MYENDTLHENKYASEASLIDRIYIHMRRSDRYVHVIPLIERRNKKV